VVVTGLYWWHPVVWWARRGLRDAEEQCCDAWVLWALPAAARAYALALVETVDFLSEARAALPQGASGIGHVHDLRRRITMIMRGATPRRLSWAGGLAVLTLAAVLLPLLPTWAQTPAGDRVTDRPADPAKKADDLKQRADELQQARDEVKKMEAQIEQMKADLDRAKVNLDQAAARLKAAKAREAAVEKTSGEMTIEIKTPDGKVQDIKVPAGSKVIQVGQSDGSVRTIEVPVQLWRFTRGKEEPLPVAPVGEKDVKQFRFEVRDVGRSGNTDERLAELEKKVKELTQQVDELRRQLKQKPMSLLGPTPPPAAPAPVTAPVPGLDPLPPAPVKAPPAPATPPPPHEQ
jgi:hypothetical protein